MMRMDSPCLPASPAEAAGRNGDSIGHAYWLVQFAEELEALEGGDQCGGVRFRASGPWLRFVHCHCSRCRHATGSGYATNLFVESTSLEWLVGKSLVTRYDLPTAGSFAEWESFYNGHRLHAVFSGGTPYEALRERLQ